MQINESISAPPIMLVGDDQKCIHLLQHLLLTGGLLGQVLTFSTGGDAASFLNQCILGDNTLPQLILLDLQMPKLVGILFLWWLRSEHVFDPLPVITMSCSKQAADIAPERRIGSDFYLYKFPTASMLRRVCHDAITSRARLFAEISARTHGAG